MLYAALSLSTVFAASAAPTPLYRFYQDAWGMAPVMLTFIFAIYAVGMLVALLTAGSLSDYVGRRRVILAGLILNAVALGLFIVADSPAWLVAARLLQGLATGIATTTLGAVLLDTDSKRGPLVNTLTPLLGMMAGALGSGLLTEFAPWPAHLVYALLLAAYGVQLALLPFVPETAKKQPGAWASMRPHVTVPARARATLWRITPANIAVWALGGLYLSLMPSLIRAATGLTSPLIGGIAVAVLTLSGVAGLMALRARSGSETLIAGTASLAVGVVITMAGVYLGSLPLLIGGTVVAGFGWGAGFSGSIRSLMPLAAPGERAGLLAALYVQSYVAFSLPAIVAGLFAPRLGLPVTVYYYGGAVILLAVASLLATVFSRRKPQTVRRDIAACTRIDAHASRVADGNHRAHSHDIVAGARAGLSWPLRSIRRRVS
jgi:MFS family permease